jgi:hypothetical protein
VPVIYLTHRDSTQKAKNKRMDEKNGFADFMLKYIVSNVMGL